MAETDEPFRVLLRMHVRSGLDREFEEVWHEVSAEISRQPANVGQCLMRGVNEPNVYYVISDWVDEQHFRAFERSPEHVEFRRRLEPLRTSVSLTTARLLYHRPGMAVVPR